MPEHAPILVVDDDPIVLKSLKEMLGLEGYQVGTAETIDEACRLLGESRFRVVLTDIRLPDGNGFDLLERVKNSGADTAVILFTGYGTIEDAVKAIKQGAFDYITKPFSDEEVKIAITRAIEQQSILEENRLLREQLNMSFHLDSFICRDAQMKKVLDTIKLIANTNTTVLITGESGTGKTLAARAIHHNSHRASKPFVEISCGSLPETLLESELFGHVKGSFTGAIANKSGKFEAANGGTIFLDEIGNSSRALQMKMLRVLESFEIEPVGGNRTISLNVRVILATNQDLKTLVDAGQFREDLYYRINVINIYLPALRRRIEDIPLLCRHFLDKYAWESGHTIHGFSEEAMNALAHYDWPGNVRELENVVQRAVVLSRGRYVTVEDLPPALQPQEPEPIEEEEIIPLKKAISKWEKRIILEALDACGGSRKDAAEQLGINRTTLYNKMRRYGIAASAED